MDYLAKILLYACIAVSVAAFAMMGIDKRRAIRNQWRIPESSLFLAAILGGGVGGTIGMFLFRHKTKHWYFRLFFPLLAIAQMVLIIAFVFFILSKKWADIQ